jgi:hypothetical protein
MAKKFFYNKVYNPRKKIISYTIIGVALIGIVLCFWISKNFRTNDSNAVIKLRDSVSVEVNSSLPDKTVYFQELSGVKEDNINVNTDQVDLSKVGDYNVKITISNQDYNVTLKVIDSTGPTLKLKDVTIAVGGSYTYEDFVDSCKDNSNEDCLVGFYTSGTDQDGNVIDYSKYKDKGTYEIKIIAKDNNDNQTIQSAKLYIGEQSSTTTNNNSSCKYGTLDYNEDKFTITSFVGDNGCALDLNLYHDENIRQNIVSIADTETKKIQSEVNNISGIEGTLTVNRNINAVLNKDAIGFIGYSLYIQVVDSNSKVIVSYYLKTDGTRVYDENPYNLK